MVENPRNSGNRYTKADKEALILTMQNLKDIYKYGTQRALDKALLAFYIETWSRARSAELATWGDIIDFEKGIIRRKEKCNVNFKQRHSGENKETNTEFKKRKKETKEQKIKDNEWAEINHRGKKTILVKLENAYFGETLKRHLLELLMLHHPRTKDLRDASEKLKNEYIFKKNKEDKYAVHHSTIWRIFQRCIKRANETMTLLNFPRDKLIINTAKPGKPLKLHFIREEMINNFIDETGDFEFAQKKAGHSDIRTTQKSYRKVRASRMIETQKDFYEKHGF